MTVHYLAEWGGEHGHGFYSGPRREDAAAAFATAQRIGERWAILYQVTDGRHAIIGDYIRADGEVGLALLEHSEAIERMAHADAELEGPGDA
jgi:hypothetical protein